MKLASEAIEEFRSIYKEEFDEELLYGEAELLAEELLEFYALLIPNQSKHGKSSNDK